MKKNTPKKMKKQENKMPKKVIAAMLVSLALVTVGRTWAQDSNPTPRATQEPSSPLAAYRLDFSVNEVEDGKKINTRQYSMNLNVNDSNEIKIGTRVPVEAKQGEFQYIDVGTKIWSRLGEKNGQLDIAIRSEMSNFAIPEQQGQQVRPVLRQLNINASTLVLPGKPMMLGSVDDPNSKRQFQLEVTVTKLR
jgi:hypothetical protein